MGISGDGATDHILQICDAEKVSYFVVWWQLPVQKNIFQIVKKGKEVEEIYEIIWFIT